MKAGALQEGGQRHDAALAAVVGPHDESYVIEGNLERDSPEDERDHPVDVRRRRVHGVVVRREHGLERVERAGPDVPEDDAERADQEGGHRGLRRGSRSIPATGPMVGGGGGAGHGQRLMERLRGKARRRTSRERRIFHRMGG
jgi:hypothetical protein